MFLFGGKFGICAAQRYKTQTNMLSPQIPLMPFLNIGWLFVKKENLSLQRDTPALHRLETQYERVGVRPKSCALIELQTIMQSSKVFSG